MKIYSSFYKNHICNQKTSIINLKFFGISNKIYTISLIGRPNVGKSSLFNSLTGQSVSLVDKLPGLTRDRKEKIVDLFGIQIKFVDTAGVDTFEENKLDVIYNKNRMNKSSLMTIDDPITNKQIIEKSIEQTRNGLIYSDLAIFIVDGRTGITEEDREIAKWLIKNKKNYEEQSKVKEEKKEELDEKSFFERVKKMKEKETIKIPEIILVANKVEENYTPWNIYDTYKIEGLNYPLFISAQQGDGLPDLLSEIKEKIPEIYFKESEDRAKKRRERYESYKQKQKESFMKETNELDNNEYSIESWEKDFEYFNGQNVEENSDYDSDNDIDPEDTFVIKSKDDVMKNKKGLSNPNTSELSDTNKVKSKKVIKVCVVGKPNVGKSSIINSIINENRVIVSEIPGTTRDVVPIQWIYKGRRIELIDTAGLKDSNTSSKVSENVEKIISKRTMTTIKMSHVVIYVIDSMKAFSPYDLKIINYIGKEGRSIVFVCNKWDLVGEGYKLKAKKWIDEQIESNCQEFKSPKLMFISAKKKYKVDSIMDEVIKSYRFWNTRISTKILNAFNNQLSKISRMPNMDGEYLRLKFITQVKVRPPSFVLFLNDIDLFFKTHEVYMKKLIVKEFGLANTPLRFIVRDRNIKSSSELLSDMKEGKNVFKKVSPSTAKIERKISLQKERMNNIAYMRRSKGKELLKGKIRPRSYKDYKRY